MERKMELTNEMQSKLMVKYQKQHNDDRRRIKELEEYVEFLKNALALALNDRGGCVVYREHEIASRPEFRLEKNISDEVIIRLIRM